VRDKIKGSQELNLIVQCMKREGKRVVFTNGCFDLLHVGHIRYLEEAKALGDVLVVGMNSDSSVRRLKGPERPILAEQERAEVLSGLGCVDYVTVFEETDPLRLISQIKPHILVKGGDWTRETTVGREVVEAAGGEVVILPFVGGSSTSNLIQTILKRYGEKSN
jgi:D-beta-D-heptose 7-phosphate kinase / D-beta-D-heptose 1-phosphate adenosyltransferase